MSDKKSILNNLFSLFSIKSNENENKIELSKTEEFKKFNSSKELKDIEDSDTIKRWKQWKSMQTDPSKVEGMDKLYDEMLSCYFNVGLFSRVVDFTINEINQTDISGEGIIIECNDKDQLKMLKDLKEKLNLDSYNRGIARDLVLFGNCFVAISLDENGVSGLLILDPKDCNERIEFTGMEVEKELRMGGSYNSLKSHYQQLDDILNLINDENNDEFDEYFKPHLIGFQFGEKTLPPWRILHFRNDISNSAFSPYGQPYFLRSLFPAKQIQMAMGYQLMARQSRMPLKVYKLRLPVGTNPTTQVEKALEFINEIQNSGMNATRKEEDGIGSTIYTIQDLFDFEMITPDIDIGKVDDLEMLMNELLISTGIPRNFVDPNGGNGFGNSAISLREQSKPFNRDIMQCQDVILDQYTQLFKIHLIQKGIEPEKIDFRLSISIPESMTNPEIVDNQNSLIELSSTLIDTLKSKILGEDSELQLPIELIRDIYKRILPYGNDIDKWINTLYKIKQDSMVSNEEESEGQENANDDGNDFTFESIKYSLNPNFKHLKETVNESVFEFKQKNILNGIVNNRHEYSSKNKSNVDLSEMLFKIKMNSIKKDTLKG